MVGPGRVELPTSRLSGVRSNHLSYGPPLPRTVTSDGQDCPIAIGQVKSGSVEQPDRERLLRPRRKRNEDGGVPPNGPMTLDLVFLSDPIAAGAPKSEAPEGSSLERR
jgi:hypothetical protein